jgi:DNA-binding IclR family transcriptional regulator
MWLERSGEGDRPESVPVIELPTRQRRVLEVIQAYHEATGGQPCPSTVIARRLRVDVSTIRDHLAALHRKGWLRAPGAPAWLRGSH